MGQSIPQYGQKNLSLLKWFKKIRAQLSFFLLFNLKNRVISLSLSPPPERNPIDRPVSRGEAIEARLQARIFSGIRGYMSGN
jgi:hypothetical protein